MMLCHLLQSWLPDEVKRLVFIPDSPAGPPLIQKMPVVLGTVSLNWVSALVTTLTRQREGKFTLQEGFYSLTICESLQLFSTNKNLLTSWGGNAASYVLLPNNRLIPTVKQNTSCQKMLIYKDTTLKFSTSHNWERGPKRDSFKPTLT